MSRPSIVMLRDIGQHRLSADIVECRFPNVVAVNHGYSREAAACKTFADDYDILADAV